MRSQPLALLWALMAALFAFGCDDDGTTEEPPVDEVGNLVEVAAADGSFGTLIEAVQAAGLETTLANEGPFTLFAPNDDAFAQLPEGALDMLLGDVPSLTRVLQYHLVAGELSAEDVAAVTSLTTLAGVELAVEVDAGTVTVGGVSVIAADIPASNGVIHVVEGVLLPPDDEPDPDPELDDIVDTAIGAGSFTTLVAAVQAAGLEETLRGEGPFTVFAPTDDAFAALPEGTVETLLMEENLELLANILLYHVVPGALTAEDVLAAETLETALGLDVMIDADAVTIGGASITMTDIEASNGIIHVIDAIIMPPEDEEPAMDIVDTAIEAGSFTTLVAAVQAAGLEETLRGEGPFTVFAPTDEAFAALPEGTVETLLMEENLEMLANILLYHVVPGALTAEDVLAAETLETALGVDVMIDAEGVTINGANIVMTDIEASNGIIHVIDAVILPPEDEAPTMDIVDTAIDAGSFTTLVAAVQAAGLEETLRGEGPFTVFAPTDEAFAALPEGTVETLLMEENLGQLADILLYHVVPGALTAADVLAVESLETALGATVSIDAEGVTINGANIVMTDIATTNGIIHVIDAVILPPEPNTIVDVADAAGDFTTLLAALEATGLDETLRGDGPFTVFAPTDVAFAALPAGTVETLLQPENLDQLVAILQLHVVAGSLTAEDVVGSNELQTVGGVMVSVDVGDEVQVGGSTIMTTDIPADNGIIHVIDSVILPAE